MKPVRYRLAVELAAAYGLLDRPGVEVVDPRPATVEEITRVHPEPYVSAIRRFSENPVLRRLARIVARGTARCSRTPMNMRCFAASPARL
ncbi:MAG TPA: hypothetical protein VK911_02660 [Vicinamibacterales bacterium]|nr:hypothetical protein [Vicinamibacterales bacterium]